MIYLASPYTDADPKVMEDRYLRAQRVVATLLKGGMFIYSPIVHCHHLALAHDMPKDHLFWQEYDEHMIGLSEMVYVLKIDGWDRSSGVASEIGFAEFNKIPVYFIDED